MHHQRRCKSDESEVDQLALFQDMHKSNAEEHPKGNENRLKMSAIHPSNPNCSKHHSHGPNGSSANDLAVCGQVGQDPLEASIESHRRSCGNSKKVLLGRSCYNEEKEEDLLTTLELGEHDYDWLMSAPTREKDCESHLLNVRHNLPSKSRYLVNPAHDEEPSSRGNGSTNLFKSCRITSGASLSDVIDVNTSSKRLMVGSKSTSRPTSPTRQSAIMSSVGSLSHDVTPTRLSKDPSKTLGMSSPKLIASNSSDVVVSKSLRPLPKTTSKLPSNSLMGRSRNIISGSNSPNTTKPHQGVQTTCIEVEANRKSSVSKSSILSSSSSSSSMTRTGMRHSLITQCETSHHDPSRRPTSSPLVGVVPRGRASLADEKKGIGKSCILCNNGNLRSKSNEMATRINMYTSVKSLIQDNKMVASSRSFEPKNISNLQLDPLLASNVGYGRSRSTDISMDPFQTIQLRGIPMHHIDISSSNIKFTSVGRFAHGLKADGFGEQFLHDRESKQDMLASCINTHHVNNDWISNGKALTIPHEFPRVTEMGSITNTELSHHVCQHGSGNLRCDLCNVKFRLRELNKKTRVSFVQASS